jgi:Pyruvate/2-oxoacid:ferredoxin oxidoreductase gamma subunit
VKIPSAGPPADTELLRQQIATARDALIAAAASLDGAEAKVGEEYGPTSKRAEYTAQVVVSVVRALRDVRDAELMLAGLEACER